ncbi:TPA: dynamin family protein [Escherichia coli]|nr:dynamin family protein [Escherichia coli]
MYTQTLYELSQEAERLLQLSRQQLQLLEKIPLSVPGDDAPQLALPWSQPNIAERHAMLNNELRKISRLEMVLAIVGTMKAGKSTTINAIVGTEVLPNRNRPMTALPTLIRHTPGQKEPVLHFSHVAPIDHLIQQLQQRLRDCDIKHLTDVLEIDKDMRALMQRIENGIAFEKYYLGAQPIFHCLKSLNDLVRLAKALDVDFPFSAYAAIEHIPVIEVEFVHLAGLESYPGQLTLLDTPGPNEAGQPHLQKMLNQQLARASAVLAVLDYTQLKSISDEEVREAILAVGQSVPLYVLVNKFDQQDRNSDDADQVRALISGTLMKGCITPQQIFPVSSMWGYLDFRAHGLNVACEQLRQNIHQVEESLQLLQLNQAQVSGEIKHEIELALTSANHFLRQQQDAVNAQLAALFQDNSESLSEMRTRCETLLQTAQNTISRDFTLRFAELESTLCRVLTDVIRPIEQQVKMELSESGFRPGFHFPVFHGVVPHFNTRQLFSEVISRQEATDEQSTRLGVVREIFSRWLNQPDWGRGNEKFPTETVDYSVLQRALSAEVDLYCQQMAKVMAEQVDESVTAGMNTFFAEFASCLTELQTRLRESMALRQQNESVVRLMQQQLQQTVMTHGWIYTDAQLLRDDIQTLFTAERY